MNADPPIWTVRLADSAATDYRNIIRWTAERFGAQQARTYATTLSLAVQALAAGPTAIGAQKRHDILPGLMTLHVARKGRKGRHFILFRVSDESARTIDILRILHDSMDLPQHL